MDGVQVDRSYPRPVADPAVMTPVSMGALQEQLEQVRQETDEGHGRLREDLNKALARIASLESLTVRQEMAMTRMDSEIRDGRTAPVPFSNINFPFPTVAGLIVFFVVMVGGQVVNLALQAGQSKLQDERSVVLKESLDDLKKQAKLSEVNDSSRKSEIASVIEIVRNIQESQRQQTRR